MKRFGLFGLFVFMCMMLLLPVMSYADDATLTWTANTEVDLAGYKVYRGASVTVCSAAAPLPALVVSGTPAQVGKVVTYLDAGLPAIDGTLCWAITAFDTAVPPNESGQSNRVTKVLNNLPPLPPTGLGAAIQ